MSKWREYTAERSKNTESPLVLLQRAEAIAGQFSASNEQRQAFFEVRRVRSLFGTAASPAPTHNETGSLYTCTQLVAMAWEKHRSVHVVGVGQYELFQAAFDALLAADRTVEHAVPLPFLQSRAGGVRDHLQECRQILLYLEARSCPTSAAALRVARARIREIDLGVNAPVTAPKSGSLSDAIRAFNVAATASGVATSDTVWSAAAEALNACRVTPKSEWRAPEGTIMKITLPGEPDVVVALREMGYRLRATLRHGGGLDTPIVEACTAIDAILRLCGGDTQKPAHLHAVPVLGGDARAFAVEFASTSARTLRHIPQTQWAEAMGHVSAGLTAMNQMLAIWGQTDPVFPHTLTLTRNRAVPAPDATRDASWKMAGGR